MTDKHALTAEQFDDPEQEHEASTLGMWVFLGTEVLFFGVLFASYAVLRFNYPEAFAEASRHTNILLGTVNTAILLTSSLTMALAIRSAQLSKHKLTAGFLLLTILLGILFLGIKGVEYYGEYEKQLVPGLNFAYEGDNAQSIKLFFYLYFIMTGVHAIHVILGIGTLAVIAVMAWREWFSSDYFTPVELVGLYWHFVDIIWIFLYPFLYLVSRG
ncbi:cytochrome c oxidase subunit III [Nitrosococcus halophilus Nc 4]|uniref:Cytochrome c oxidase subunit III n=1 Tax=Nitrosococcus halophilus (strain Nc4) TaxID=472759 RepID=D5BWN1_NITHN|nr:cytochrome c oxidase subunit 3 [Nitrosococcus halophilus]ADE15688.1 cytochrome c oxidase subunit III [Nitrosococcus halophilus Nc 4]